MKLNIGELLFLLKFARAERSSTNGQGSEEFLKRVQFTFRKYEYWIRKCLVLENLNGDLLGLFLKS
jgi:hypothetical protein